MATSPTSTELLLSLADQLPVGVVAVDTAGRVRYVNGTLCEITNAAPTDLFAYGWFRAIHPADQAAAREGWSASYQGSRPISGELRLGAGDTTRYARIALTPVPDIGGGHPGMVGTVIDVTARRFVEIRDRQEAQRAQLAGLQLPGAIIALLNPDLHISHIGGQLVHARVEPDSLVGAPVTALARIPDASALTTATANALSGIETSLAIDSDRLGVNLAAQISPYRDESGTIIGALLVGTDVTHERLSGAALANAEHRFGAIFDQAPIGMALVDLDGRLRQTNRALTEITGRPPKELEATSLQSIVHPDDLAVQIAGFGRILGSGSDEEGIELRYVHAKGYPVWVNVHTSLVRDTQGEPDFLIVQVQDVTERRRFEDRLRYMADHDPLTGLPNRRAFEAALSGHVDHVERYGPTGGLLVLDLDGFKYVNDTLGHSAGDALLINVAAVLQERLRTTDVLGRLGGDEFAVLLPQGGREETLTVAQSLVEAIRDRPNRLEGEIPGLVTTSIGVSLFAADGRTAEEVMISADLAMYEAKETGRNRACMANDSTESRPQVEAPTN